MKHLFGEKPRTALYRGYGYYPRWGIFPQWLRGSGAGRERWGRNKGEIKTEKRSRLFCPQMNADGHRLRTESIKIRPLLLVSSAQICVYLRKEGFFGVQAGGPCFR
jgi:hypothetical protein